jgi:hypothetical protein
MWWVLLTLDQKFTEEGFSFGLAGGEHQPQHLHASFEHGEVLVFLVSIFPKYFLLLCFLLVIAFNLMYLHTTCYTDCVG